MELMQALGYKSVNEFSKALGYAQSEKVQRLFRSDENQPSATILTDIANKFANVNLRWLLSGSGEMFHSALNSKHAIRLVPVTARAGYLTGFGDPEYLQELPYINIDKFSGKTHRAFEIGGDSMEPTLKPGDIFIGRIEEKENIHNGQLYVINTVEEGLVVKRLFYNKKTGEVECMSDNDYIVTYKIHIDTIQEIFSFAAIIRFELPSKSDLESRMFALEKALDILKKQLKSKKK